MKLKNLPVILLLLLLMHKSIAGMNPPDFGSKATINVKSSLSSLHTCSGSSSPVKDFSINVTDISSSVSIHATKHLEVSVNQNAFDSNYINLYPVSNSVQNKSIYVRLGANNAAGIYKDTIFITSSAFDAFFIILTDTVLATPITRFISPSVCFGTYIHFQDSSSITADILNSRTWDFGDGTSSTQINPSHSYVAAGNYRVKLSVSSLSGCSKDSTAIVSVFPSPKAKIAVSNSGCANATVLFIDSTSLNGSVLKTWKWDFGDSLVKNISTDQNSTHTYKNHGSYTISLAVSTDKACTDSTSIGILINANAITPVVTADINLCEAADAKALTVNALPGYSLIWYQQAIGGRGFAEAPIPSTAVTGETFYFVSQQNNSSGCISERSKIKVTVNAVPEKPTISRDANNNLLSSAITGNQWFNTISAIPLDSVQIFKPAMDAVYYVQTTQNNCKSQMSEPYQYTISNTNNRSSTEMVNVFPNPVISDFTIEYKFANCNTVIAELFNINHVMVKEKLISSGYRMNLSDNLSGNYILRLVDCKTKQLLYTCHILKVK